MLVHLVLSQDLFVLVLGHFTLFQDLPFKCWDTSHCRNTLRPTVGTLHTVPRPSVETPRTVPGLYPQVLGHFARSQDHPLKRWNPSHRPKTVVLVLRHFLLSQDLVLGHLALSQDLSLQCLDTSHCPKTLRPKVGTHRTVPIPLTQVLGHFALSLDLPLKCWDTSHCSKTTCSSVGIPRTVPRPLTQMLGHLALSQDPSLKRWDTSHCPRTPHSSAGKPRTVPRPCYSRISCSSVLEHLDHYPWYHHLSSSVKNSPKPNFTDQKFYLLAPLYLPPFINPLQVETRLVFKCLVVDYSSKTDKISSKNVKI